MLENDVRPPGQFIRDELERRGWTQRDLAFVLGIAEQAVNMLVTGKRGVSADMAKALGAVFEVSPEHILGLQKAVETVQELARAKTPAPGVSRKARLTTAFPVREMVKRGWITYDPETIENQIARFFGVTTLDEIPHFDHAAKKTHATMDNTPTQLAWLYRVRQIAAEMIVTRYSPQSGRGAVAKLSRLLAAAEEARKAPRVLAECGIRFVIVESLPGAKIDGVCFWLNETSPVIGMSLRHDRIDNFWFVLRHELEHVLKEHGKSAVIVDTELEGDRAGSGAEIPEEERLANEAAAEFCVPQDSLRAFIARKHPFFAERDIIGFSRTLQVHPGLVAGQLQHKTGRYDRFRSHQMRIRSIVAPNVQVDGWGDVAPVEP